MTAMLPTAIVCVAPLGSVTTTFTLEAGLGPLLVIVIVAVIVWPTVTDDGTLRVTPRSESIINVVATLAVLLASVDSAVVVWTTPLKFCTVVLDGGTVYAITTT